MLAAVVPARDEAHRIGIVLRHLLRLPLDLIVPVVNGCKDHTWQRVRAVTDSRVEPLHYRFPLGVDVPRACGAFAAYSRGADVILFVDGDMIEDMNSGLRHLLGAVVRGGMDLALTDPYTSLTRPGNFARPNAALTSEINIALGLQTQGAASPSHGPHAVSRRLLEAVPMEALAVPPVALALAARAGLRIGVGARIRHADLGSDPRDREHRRRIGETIIGDCLEALCIARDEPRSRRQGGREYLGYHPLRRIAHIFPAEAPAEP